MAESVEQWGTHRRDNIEGWVESEENECISCFFQKVSLWLDGDNVIDPLQQLPRGPWAQLLNGMVKRQPSQGFQNSLKEFDLLLL